MIEIKNLTKIYDKTKEPVKALRDVSLVLPDKGLIFVLGKSGSGKSTFLNMLGGLDNVTSGDILINGKSIVNLKDSDLDKYRNDYIGIIYQNFNLFVNETVKENIMTSSIISSKKINSEDVTNICKKLDLSTKENVLVKNLSGGQKQRVAIGRALIKDPEVILADEPTGNLDSKTTKTIFNILKKIAKEKLVLVISHDIASAEKYADRIIYLSDGKVSDDVVKNKKFKKPTKNSIELPNDKEYTDQEIKSINESLSKHNLKVTRAVERFVPFENNITTDKPSPEFKNSKGTAKLSLSVSHKFFKSTIASFTLTLVILTFIIGILALSQSFAQFDNNGAVADIARTYESKAFIVNKAYSYYDDTADLNKDYAIEVSEEDVEKYYDSGYRGNVYKIYNTPVVTSDKNFNNEVGRVSGINSIYNNGIYSTTALGTVVCDYDYLKYLYGDIEVVAGSLYDLENNSKLIVTDYVADSLLAMDLSSGKNQYISFDPNDPYQKIVNTKLWNRYTIGAVIDTGYKVRYKSLFDAIDRLKKEIQNAREIAREIYTSKIYIQYLDELNSSLNFTYSVNENFKEAYIKETTGLAVWVRNCILAYNGGKSQKNYNCDAYIYAQDGLTENTMLMNYVIYNELFNKNVTLEDTSGFEVQEITLYNYSVDQEINEIPKTVVTLKIVGVTADQNNMLGSVSLETQQALAEDMIVPYSLVFDNAEDSFIINDTAKNNFYYTTLRCFAPIFQVCNIIEIFSSIFGFIVIALLFIVFLMIVSHNLRTIKKNQYRIGVFKGLGCPGRVFSWACLYNTAILVLSTFATSIVFVAISGKLLNNVLANNFHKFVGSKVMLDFTFVKFSFSNMLLYMLLVLIVGAVSIFAPILKLRKLKPNLIINKAE